MSSDTVDETQLRVLSLNCWGLKYIAKNRSERVAGIAQELKSHTHDVIALQEIWVFTDYELIRDSVAKRLPYAKFFYSGALGAGLAIFSKFRIIETSIHPYSLNGEPMDVLGGDWMVGKAAASVVISHPILDKVQIFNTHLYAKGGEDGPEHRRAHRLVNAWEFAKLAKIAADLGRYVIAAGDFNSIPTTLPMTIIRDHTGLSDAWSTTHPHNVATPYTNNASPPLEAIMRYGVTADSPFNSYSAGKALDPHARKFLGKRLDYILYRQPSRPYATADQEFPILEPSHCKVLLTEKVPGYDFSFSDHFALEATFEIYTPDAATSVAGSSSTQWQLEETRLSNATVSTTIQALTSCYRFSRERSRRELIIFTLLLVLLVGIAVGASWNDEPWISSVIVILTIFFSWMATTFFYEGFIFGYWELNALTNVIEELEIYQHQGHGARTRSTTSNSSPVNI